ncbi:MAG: MBL fold metallo-hydrolase [Saprospiraceae bacterium]|nr:MBL fold metallo-hydrolase [Saprospiraceae bacterium]
MKTGLLFSFFLFPFFNSFFVKNNVEDYKIDTHSEANVSVVILGNVQDAGFPHIGCNKSCCKNKFKSDSQNEKVVSLGIIDQSSGKRYLIEATPDITQQIKLLKNTEPQNSKELPDGIFITHAHIGHYSGLMYLGREGMNSKETKVYLMPFFKSFIENNGPWNQLVKIGNIVLNELQDEKEIALSESLKVKPVLVPHRDEYSETVGFIISGKNKSILFIPDIDKWNKWDHDIIDLIQKVDYAFIDGTFYDANELPGRSMEEIPHPFIKESMELFKTLTAEQKSKIHFIHLNHTNPALDPKTKESKLILKKGFNVARMGMRFEL